MIHDGQADVAEGVIFGLRLLPIDRIFNDWEILRRIPDDGSADARIKSIPQFAVQCCDTHPGWVPLTDDWSGSHFGVDLAQGLSGTWGQVINFGKSESIHYAVSNSWREFLADVMDELANGNFSLIEHEDGDVEFKLAKPTTGYLSTALHQFYPSRTH